MCRTIEGTLEARRSRMLDNLDWLCANMNPYFFITMKEETEAVSRLAETLHTVPDQRKVTLVDQERRLMVACLDIPGSLYDTLKSLREREISYAELNHSYRPIPGAGRDLEIQRFEFERRDHQEIAEALKGPAPRGAVRVVASAMREFYPAFEFGSLGKDLRLLWLNNPDYVRISPAERIARILWLYEQGRAHDGLYLDVEGTKTPTEGEETRILFSVGNPAERGFMTQTSEIFQRLNIGVRRSYSLNISTGVHLYFLGTFYVTTRDGRCIEKGSDLFRDLKAELYNTQILSTRRSTYTEFVAKRIMTGEEASLTNAIMAFCHALLAHTRPDRFSMEAVKSTFHSSPDMTLRIIGLFRKRFDPHGKDDEQGFEKAVKETARAVEEYNTGHRHLDEIRKTVFQTALLFIRYTLKTNFFVPEKHALAFRLDPAFMEEMGEGFSEDLPQATPFRVTFFFGRNGVGFHIGFSDIARGGWRTVICTTRDEYTTNTSTLFREVFVLAHTQHLKNKDIYEGGSKLTAILDARDLDSSGEITQRLYKLQYGFINAFLDIFVTENGRVKNPAVKDYYRDDEPIELGPDENMHDNMIELIARQSVKRGYLLGIGIMSSKRVGINHKEYGVTSRGVIRFAEIAMKEIGVDMEKDPFTVKITGGTNGDVAGNSMLLLLERCPRVKIVSIVAGSGALYDPEGIDREEIGRLLLKKDVVDFRPERLHPGGFILFRRKLRQEGLRELHRKLVCTALGVTEEWITTDEFYSGLEDLIFSVRTDLFLPCGGRPETIHGKNWQNLFAEDGTPTARVISEGANSFITPDARVELQKRGIVVLRDASANKCGVISSSYEIMANLLMTEKEFLRHKDRYVKDVLGILESRAADEANLIFKRYRENHGRLLYTEISRDISSEINHHYATLFSFFQSRPELAEQRLFRRALLNHLPAFIRETPRYRARVNEMPVKIRYAILASEISRMIVYGGGWEMDLESRLRGYLKRELS